MGDAAEAAAAEAESALFDLPDLDIQAVLDGRTLHYQGRNHGALCGATQEKGGMQAYTTENVPSVTCERCISRLGNRDRSRRKRAGKRRR